LHKGFFAEFCDDVSHSENDENSDMESRKSKEDEKLSVIKASDEKAETASKH
jgi:hypothetical protein